MSAEEIVDLGFNGLRKQRTRSLAQNMRELIIECSWLNEFRDGIVRHGISLLQWRSGGSSTPTICRLTDSCRHQLLAIAPQQRDRPNVFMFKLVVGRPSKSPSQVNGGLRSSRTTLRAVLNVALLSESSDACPPSKKILSRTGCDEPVSGFLTCGGSTLFRSEPGGFDDGSPQLGVCLLYLGKLRGCRTGRLQSGFQHLVLDLVRLHGSHDRRIQARDDLGWRLCRRIHAEPAAAANVIARLDEGRHIGQREVAVLPGGGEDPDFSSLVYFDQCLNGAERHRQMATDEIWNGWTATLVGDVPQIKRSLSTKEHAEEVWQRPRSGTAVCALAWIGFKPIHKLPNRFGRNGWPYGNAE